MRQRMPQATCGGEGARWCSVRLVRQRRGKDCGAAALTMILRFYGYQVSLEQVTSRCRPTAAGGVSADQLIRVGRGFGLIGMGVDVDVDTLGALRTPAILHWRGRHYVVLEGMIGRSARVLDPGLGRFLLGRRQLQTRFRGTAIVFRPSGSGRAVSAAVQRTDIVREWRREARSPVNPQGH
jgi:ABC-type bacteriocin/lantibiotic exporter with double-glycine peptidase domain